MKRIPDLIALLLSLIALGIVYQVTTVIYEGVPHVEDEVAYSWQAALYAEGQLTTPTPPCPHCFLTPFVVDHDGLRFSKYPPGWAAALSLGVRLDLRDWVNPILAALCIWFTYRLASRFTNRATGLIAALLTLTSPFFLLNAGTLLAHLWSFFLTLAWTIAWIDSTRLENPVPRWLSILVAGLSLGLLALTRPLTAIGVAIPFFIHGLILLLTKSGPAKKAVSLIAAITGVVAGLFFVWQYAVTGDFLLNPYTLWWPYDKIGFGPGIGVQEGGHNLYWAWVNLRQSLNAGISDLFGWTGISWLFMPVGLLALRKTRAAWTTLAIAPSLMATYMLYWVGAVVFGPRYYFEGLISATLLSAAGISWLAGNLTDAAVAPAPHWLSRLRFALTAAVVVLLISVNLLNYLPVRLGGMFQLYGASRQQLAPFKTDAARELTPALIFVHRQQNWREYATLLELSSPLLNSPFVFVFSRSEADNQKVINSFPNRSIWHYYPDEPYRFYTAPRP
ncbi:MAG: glycosyltransferase family 39 protein [Bellilinea sp.]